MAEVPSFEEFYAATHNGRTPFPWQDRLAQKVVAHGWPAEIGVPTGLGKTSCIDIAVWALATQAVQRPPSERTAPTRTWYVVNRRLLVDSAFDHGLALAKWCNDPGSLRDDWKGPGDGLADAIDMIRSVRMALRSAAGNDRTDTTDGGTSPLHVARLRGGADLGARAPLPSQPTLVFATVPMFASRWMFRGYGSSTSMRPVDAALAGIDSLVLLDEAHLARPLARLAGPLAACDVGDPSLLVPRARARPQIVALTATGEAHGDRFDLDERDHAHPEIRKRLHAAKPTSLRSSTKRQLPADLARAAVDVLGPAYQSTTCLVFANTPATARAVFDQLKATGPEDATYRLLTGRMREREASAGRRTVLDPVEGAPSGRDRALPRERHLVVVATQTLEVGADVDFEHLVTETAGVRSMVQRFGRLNRLGNHDHATATVVHPHDIDDWPVYGQEPAEVHRRLSAVEESDRSLSPARVAVALGEPDDVPDETAELLPHHLWDWAKTSRWRAPLAEIEPFYEGRDASIGVSVIWRAYVPGQNDDGARSQAEATDYEPTGGQASKPLRLFPTVAGAEAVELPLWELRDLFERREIESMARLGRDGVTVESVEPPDLRPGDQVILRASGRRVGFYDDCGWAPDADNVVTDLSQLRAGLVITVDAIRAVFDVPDDQLPEVRTIADALRLHPVDEDDLDEFEQQRLARIGQLRELLAGWAAPADRLRGEDEEALWSVWRDAVLVGLDSGAALSRLDDDTPFIPAAAATQGAARSRADVLSDALDDLSFVADVTSPLLDDHLQAAAELAHKVADVVGVPAGIAAVVEEAARMHDIGKLEPRFQRWLDPEADLTDDPREALAKSDTPRHRREATRVAAGWPRGGRHELLSARLLNEALDDEPLRDLLLHLVISHHGHGRPAVGVAHDPTPTKVTASVRGRDVTVEGDVSTPDWEQPSRFSRLCATYGYWGLALLEAIVRQSDHIVSAAPSADRTGRPKAQPTDVGVA